jgi:hypothetical protein
MEMKKNDTALNILMPGKLYADAKNAAGNRNISLAALVRMALTEWLEDKGEQAGETNIDEIFASMRGKIMKDG